MKSKITKMIASFAVLLLAAGCRNSSENTKLLEDIELIPVRMSEVKGDLRTTYVTLDGKQAFDKRFFDADFFSDGLAKVTTLVDEQYLQTSFINTKGETVFDAPYKNVTGFWNGRAWAKKEDSVVALNTKGEEVFVLDGTPKTMFNADGKAMVKTKDGNYGIVDKSGAVSLLADTLTVVTSFPIIYANRLVVRNKHGKEGIIDLRGNVIVDFGVYTNISPYDINGCALVSVDGESIWVDKDGKKLADEEFGISQLGRFHGHCDGDLYVYVGSGQVDYYPCTFYHSWRDKNGKEVGELADLGRVAKEAAYVGGIFQGFYGSEYAYWGNFRIDRKGNVTEMPFKKAVSPLIGGKVLFAKFLDDEKNEKNGLFSKDGELLNDVVSLRIDIRDLGGDRKGVGCGAPYVDTELVTRGY
ncbi:WG repeat-containing protein [Bacteroides sp. AN502(2024)]|uniref:WG repeat-containing protein n=1 Tax=Bacteroides sp. AN502(2024) TaxID=3160599 RepID=UPI0035150B27